MQREKLNGCWAAWTDETVAAEFFEVDFGRKAEFFLPVPGHWQQEPLLSHHQGSVFYRHTFQHKGELGDDVLRLTFGGAFYLTTVWLNGKLLGHHEGYFQPFEFELTEEILHEGENVLAVRVDCPPHDKDLKDIIVGAYGDWDCKPSFVNPGGIWGDVLLERTRLGYLQRVQIDSKLTAWNSALVTIKLPLVWRGAEGKVFGELKISPRNFSGKELTHQQEIKVSTGLNRLEMRQNITDPKLWSSWDHGHPFLYNLSLTVRDDLGNIVDQFDTYFGIRSIEWRNWQLSVNDRRIFLRGCNYGPASFYPASVKVEDLQRDVDLIAGANLNFVRIHTHVAHPEFYRICAEKGIIIWQDFPLDKRYEHQITGPALRQIREMVNQLYNEPAICFWSCHNEPHALPEKQVRHKAGKARLLGQTARSSRPTWNKDVLDPRLKAAVQHLDSTRPVFAYSGVLGVLRGGSATHQYFGWNTGNYRSLQLIGKLFPQLLRFVSEYGAQSWPNNEELLAKVENRELWPSLNWPEVEKEFLLNFRQLHEHVDPLDYDNFEAYVDATQRYQAELLQFYHETLRKLKYRPCGGMAVFYFADAWPLVSWSILDYQRNPKLAYQITRRAMQPVQVMLDWPNSCYFPGDEWLSQIYLVNDLQRNFPVLGLSWRLVGQDGRIYDEERRVADAEPDSVKRVGELRVTIPEGASGELRLELTIELPSKEKITNSYNILVCD